ncbi:MAG TPA: TrkH family potassium uptake protein [Cellvibrionaceae bacterium]
MRLIPIVHLCSVLLILYSLSMFGPILVNVYYGDGDFSGFFITFILAFSTGITGWQFTRRSNTKLSSRDGFLVVVLFWLVFSVVSALPFILDKFVNASITDAFFESISGITTTGGTIVPHVDTLPHSILFYRAQLNFLGGLGIIVLALAILPLLGVGGSKIYQSESVGPLREDKLSPRLADTAKQLWMVYSGLAVAAIVSFKVAGLNWFDSICYALSTVALGGFSIHDASLGFYNNLSVEMVAGIFSFLSGINFALYYRFTISRKVMPLLRDPELKAYFFIALGVAAFTILGLYRAGNFPITESIVHGFFQSMSVMTDNGLTTANYPNWPPHIAIFLMLSSYVGGCVGSTCGGIKIMRVLLCYRQTHQEIKQLIHTNGIFPTKINTHIVSDRMMQSVWSFAFLYLFISVVFVVALMMCGNDIQTAFGTVSACINNMGVGYGTTAVNFAGLNETSKWLMCAAMLLGRLEIFPILVIFSRTYWRF